MLTNASAIRSVLLSDSSRQQLAGRTVIQGTITPTETRAISEEVAGGDYLEAPVLGSIPEAKAGKLIVMVGGSTISPLVRFTAKLWLRASADRLLEPPL